VTRVPGVEGRAGKFPGPSLIPALTAIQRRHGWLPCEELVGLSRQMHRPLYEIEGLVSFYPHFRTDPPPKSSVHVCHDLACWLHGADARIAELRAQHADEEDVEVVEVSCLGRCDSAPAVAVDEIPPPTPPWAHRGPWPNDPYAPGEERYRVLKTLLDGTLDPESVVGALQESGLRGMGGAGFPTGKKWELVAAQDATVKYGICNADESEPGTFKDREILATQPHLVLEGLLVGMVCVGATQGWVFIRHEYGPEEAVLRAELDRLRDTGLVGDDLEVDVFVSPGGYILGEETALIECMEGHRGEPRNKPPFPGVYGLWGKPTLMNSVETFAHVPAIVERGAGWWKAQGVRGSHGLKFLAVSGHVERPGVYCVPMGTTIRELLNRAGGVSGGAQPQAVQPGGASSNFLGPDQLDVPLDFSTLQSAGSMLGSGALVVVAEGTDVLAAATNVLRFFRNESCGKCVPCRVGSTKAHSMLSEALADGGLDEAGEACVRELEETMRLTSICGLGQVALGPVVSVFGLQRGATVARPHPRPGP
jgi:NADH:ubiquinone oxidoreductase subunit F (NADH-binding)